MSSRSEPTGRNAQRRWVLSSFWGVLLFSASLGAHGRATSQLRLHLKGSQLDGEWELELRDARIALGLEPEVASLSELREREPALRAYLAQRLSLRSNGVPCVTRLAERAAIWHPEQSQLVFALSASCASEPRVLSLTTDILFDREPAHRAYFWIEDARVTHAGVLRAEQRSASVDIRQFHVASGFFEFVREGVRHIWSGLDHVLFLLALLLPAALSRTDSGWARRASELGTLRETAKVVTAFTVAHSITLCCAFFGLVSLPSRWVEVAIAVSVFAAAWNNIRPFLPGRAWLLAFAFGLVHGLGFAGALRNLPLPIHARGLALFAFNLGVELGQLVIAALLVPLLQAAARRAWYPRRVLGFGSLVIAWLALLWILERGFGVPLLGGAWA